MIGRREGSILENERLSKTGHFKERLANTESLFRAAALGGGIRDKDKVASGKKVAHRHDTWRGLGEL